MPMSDYGQFMARAYTAGALPVEGAIIRIVGGEEGNRTVAYSLITDRDGATDTIQLPAPRGSLSMEPDSSELPYSVYDLEISAEGYYPRRIYGITVFSGVKTIQEINMIPSSDNPEERIRDYPRGNINAVIPPNEELY